MLWNFLKRGRSVKVWVEATFCKNKINPVLNILVDLGRKHIGPTSFISYNLSNQTQKKKKKRKEKNLCFSLFLFHTLKSPLTKQGLNIAT